MTLLDNGKAKHIKENIATYVALFALIITIIVQITIITRWGTQIEDKLDDHITSLAHPYTFAQIEEIKIAREKSNITLSRIETELSHIREILQEHNRSHVPPREGR